MTTKQRKDIVRESKRRIEIEIKDFLELEVGRREIILDEYINSVCKEKGFDFINFYATDGNKLNELLDI